MYVSAKLLTVKARLRMPYPTVQLQIQSSIVGVGNGRAWVGLGCVAAKGLHTDVHGAGMVWDCWRERAQNHKCPVLFQFTSRVTGYGKQLLQINLLGKSLAELTGVVYNVPNLI